MLDALSPDEHLIEIPLVIGPRTAAAQVAGEVLAEFPASAPNGLIGDENAPLGQQELNVPKAEVDHVIRPDSLADDLGRKVTPIVRAGRGLHATSLADPQRADLTRVP
jgi:hypothetical protein